jgi:hypothetical protein
MSKKMNWYFVIAGIALVLIMAVSAIILFAFKPELAGLVLPKQSAMSANTDAPCQCVGLVTNEIFGVGKIAPSYKGKNWLDAQDLHDIDYWDKVSEKTNKKYIQVLPVSPKLNDVMIMRQDAKVWVKMIPDLKGGFSWGTIGSVGQGSGHIGFVSKATYYNGNFSIANVKGPMSGWLITMRSANWGIDYYPVGKSWFVDTSKWNPYSLNGRFESMSGCNNVTYSEIFLPTGNPVSFWRRSN